MSPPPTSIDGTDITGATIDGQEVQEITVDGQSVFSSGFDISDIPDNQDLHAAYDAKKLSQSDGQAVSTFPDVTGNGFDLSVTPNTDSPTYVANGMNGNPVVRFDGIDDFLATSFSPLSQPVSIFASYRWREVNTGGKNSMAWTTNNEFTDSFRLQDTGKGESIMFAGNILGSGSIDTQEHIIGALYNTSNSAFRKDGVVAGSGNVGSDVLNGYVLGDNAESFGSFAEVDFGEILIYPLQLMHTMAESVH